MARVPGRSQGRAGIKFDVRFGLKLLRLTGHCMDSHTPMELELQLGALAHVIDISIRVHQR